MSPARRRMLALGAIAATAVAVRAIAALVRPPWHDEYFTAWAAALPLRELIDALRADSGPPLPYLLAKLVAAAGLAPLLAARVVSVVAGSAAVIVAALAARRMAGYEAGLWCGALVALHPLAIAWSCEGRAYALLLLAAALAWARLQAARSGGRGAPGLAVAIALACWSHALGLLLAGAVAIAAFTLEQRARRRALVGVAVGLATFLPWLPVAAAQPPAATAWMTAAWQTLSPLERLAAPVRLLPTAAAFASHLDLPSAPVLVQALAGLACLALLVVGSADVGRALRARNRRGAPAPHSPSAADGGAANWELLPAMLLTALPALALGALAWAGAPYLFPGRSEALILAPFAGLLAAGAARGRGWRIAAAALVAAGTATIVTALIEWRHAPPTGEARLAAAIEAELSDGGTVVIGGYWRLGLEHHLGAARGSFTLVNLPASAAGHPGWYDDTGARPSAGEFATLEARLVMEVESGRAVAVVVTPGLVTARALESLARSLGLRVSLRVPGAVLWTRPPAR